MEDVIDGQRFAVCVLGLLHRVSSDKSAELDLTRCLNVSAADLQALNSKQ